MPFSGVNKEVYERERKRLRGAAQIDARGLVNHLKGVAPLTLGELSGRRGSQPPVGNLPSLDSDNEG